jgi:hypothetical protein
LEGLGWIGWDVIGFFWEGKVVSMGVGGDWFWSDLIGGGLDDAYRW